MNLYVLYIGEHLVVSSRGRNSWQHWQLAGWRSYRPSKLQEQLEQIPPLTPRHFCDEGKTRDRSSLGKLMIAEDSAAKLNRNQLNGCTVYSLLLLKSVSDWLAITVSS